MKLHVYVMIFSFIYFHLCTTLAWMLLKRSKQKYKVVVQHSWEICLGLFCCYRLGFLVTVVFVRKRGKNDLKLEDNFFYSLISSTCYTSNKNCFSHFLKFLHECSSKWDALKMDLKSDYKSRSRSSYLICGISEALPQYSTDLWQRKQ